MRIFAVNVPIAAHCAGKLHGAAFVVTRTTRKGRPICKKEPERRRQGDGARTPPSLSEASSCYWFASDAPPAPSAPSCAVGRCCCFCCCCPPCVGGLRIWWREGQAAVPTPGQHNVKLSKACCGTRPVIYILRARRASNKHKPREVYAVHCRSNTVCRNCRVLPRHSGTSWKVSERSVADCAT